MYHVCTEYDLIFSHEYKMCKKIVVYLQLITAKETSITMH